MGCSARDLRFVVGEYASILADYGDAFDNAELILPTSEHFPDEFHRDADSVQALLERVMSYTPLADDLDVKIGFVEGEGEAEGKSCSSGGCGGGNGWARVDGVVDEGDGYRVLVHVADTASPVRLVGSLVRGVGSLLLLEAGEKPDDIGPRSEIWAGAAGLGVLALSASHVYSKSCGGVNMHQGTALGPDALATMVALFCAVRGIKPGRASAHLSPTPKEAFEEAWRTIDSNRALVKKLRESPELLADGVFELEAQKGIFSRLFARDDKEPEIQIKRNVVRSEDEQRRIEEARALVEEALLKP